MARRQRPTASPELQERVTALRDALLAIPKVRGGVPFAALARSLNPLRPDAETRKILSLQIGWPVRSDYQIEIAERLGVVGSASEVRPETFGCQLARAAQKSGFRDRGAFVKALWMDSRELESVASDVSRFIHDKVRPHPVCLARILDVMGVNSPERPKRATTTDAVALITAAAEGIEWGRKQDRGAKIQDLYSIWLCVWVKCMPGYPDDSKYEAFLHWVRNFAKGGTCVKGEGGDE